MRSSPRKAKPPQALGKKDTVKDLASLTTVQEVYSRALAHSPRHARKVVQAVLVNSAGWVSWRNKRRRGGCQQSAQRRRAAPQAVHHRLGAKAPDRFLQEAQNLFFSLPHPPHFDDCFQFSDACRYQGILAGVIIAGLSKIPAQTRGLETDKRRIVTDAFGVHLNSVRGAGRVLQHWHMPVLWPAGRSFAKASQNAKYNAREHVFRFVATIEDFMIASPCVRCAGV